MKDLVFYNLFKSSLLFYSWNQIKSPSFFGSYFPVDFFPPFSSFWFKKTSYLIREGKFVYKKNNKASFLKYKNRKAVVNKLGQFVIELSFINIIEQIRKDYSTFNLTKCLRYLRDKFIFYLKTFMFL